MEHRRRQLIGSYAGRVAIRAELTRGNIPRILGDPVMRSRRLPWRRAIWAAVPGYS